LKEKSMMSFCGERGAYTTVVPEKF
jgi:hypothetical protein